MIAVRVATLVTNKYFSNQCFTQNLKSPNPFHHVWCARKFPNNSVSKLVLQEQIHYCSRNKTLSSPWTSYFQNFTYKLRFLSKRQFGRAILTMRKPVLCSGAGICLGYHKDGKVSTATAFDNFLEKAPGNSSIKF